MSRMAFRVVIFSLLLGLASATIIHVPDDQPTIQGGLNAASDNDTVLVAPGTYCENLNWPNTHGIDLRSEAGEESTIIDGNSSGPVIRISVTVNADSTTMISGFTIRNGMYA